MNDPIERQAAIDAIDKEQKEIDVSDVSAMYAYSKCKTIIKQLPSALGTNLAEVGTDYISRQDAIDMIRNHWSDFSNADNYRTAKACVDAVPPIRPKRGKWTADNACSKCGCQPWFSRDIHNYNFCPNCGADMRER